VAGYRRNINDTQFIVNCVTIILIVAGKMERILFILIWVLIVKLE
jgi:hypothetical protein